MTINRKVMSAHSLLNEWREHQGDVLEIHNLFEQWFSSKHCSEGNPTCTLHDYEQKTETLLIVLKDSGIKAREQQQLIYHFFQYLTGFSDPYVQDLMKKAQKYREVR